MKKYLSTFCFVIVTAVINYAQVADNWEWMNPKPQGNSINAIDFVNDNIGYAAGTFGTIIKTTDGGVQWNKLNTSTSAPFYSLDFVTSDIGFAGGTNQFLIKTIDGGTTWTQLQLPVTGQYDTSFSVMDIKFLNDQTGFVLGFFLMENKIWKTTDGGSTWSTYSTGSAQYLSELYFIDDMTGFGAGGALGGEIAKTTNGGSSWQLVYQPDYKVMSIIFINSLTGFAGAEGGRVYKTTDGGNSWNSMWSETSLDITSIIFTGPSIGFGFGTGSVYTKTTDGGSSWYEYSLNIGSSRQYFDAEITPNGKIHAAGSYGAMIYSTDGGTTFNSHPYITEGYISDIEFVSTQTGYAVAGYAGGDILKTTNAGQTWVSQITGYSTPIYGIAFTSAETGYLAGSLKLYKTTNGGTNWATIFTSPYNDIYTDIFFTNENTGYAVGSYGKLLKTTNAGASWSTSTIASSMLSSIFFVNESAGYAVGDNNSAVKTTDGGVTWQPMSISSGVVNHNNIYFINTDTGYTASTTGIFKTTNGGVSWFSAGAPAGGYSDIMFRGNFGYAVTTDGKIIKSTNAGASWIVQPTVTSNGLYTLYFNTDNYVYAGGILGTMIKTIPTELMQGSTTFALTVNVLNGWNMVSIPGLHPTDQNVGTWWQYRDLGANVFRYTGGYQSVTTAAPGIGYWMKHDGALTYNTGGEWPAGGIQIVAHDPLVGASGWNLIGGYELSVTATNITTNPPGLQSGPIYKYAGGYSVATTIDPGNGYWIKLNAAGQIIIPETMAKGSVTEYFPKNWGRIIISDATGTNYTLYSVKGEVDLSNYDLPPAPPAGMFDIRYSSGRIAEDINSSIKAIDMSGATYPLTVRVENMDIRLMDETGKTINANLKKGEDIVISDATIQKLMVTSELIPAQYSLEQNYPNPFNPSTIIEFSLPENVGNVKLSIYNALGEKVAELVNTALTAGKYQYQWNAQSVATGMYIYELRTDKFVSVKKMILIK